MDNPVVRTYLIGLLIVLFSGIYIYKLFQLQVMDDSYDVFASNNTLRYVTQYPARGLVYDRDGELLVYNQAAYDIMVIPKHLESFDTTEFCRILRIEREELEEGLEKARNYSSIKPSAVVKMIPARVYGELQEKMYKFPGFYVQARSLRKYPRQIAGHVLGYVGEVTTNEIQDEPGCYRGGDYIGKSGIEKSYEKIMRGQKGRNILVVDVHNRVMGKYMDGKYDSASTAGHNITITIDAELQEYGQKLMENKKGAIVAIEPSTGEILALVSSPTYDPNLLVGRPRSANYAKLQKDSLNPLYNRAVSSTQPPGSTFKPLNAAAALQDGYITANEKVYCAGPFEMGPIVVNDHNFVSPLNVTGAIQYSSNNFFCQLFVRMISRMVYNDMHTAYNSWRKHVTSFGAGVDLGTDFANTNTGNVPKSSYYDKLYGRRSWGPLTVISLAIGQGEILVTPLQMANYSAAIANRGYYYIPHVIKHIQGSEKIPDKFTTPVQTSVDREHFDPLVEGMVRVMEAGTGTFSLIPGIAMAGKTGTAENPHGADHSIFIAFAPVDKPQIAISVYVENAGYGATWAGPIASLMIEKYLTGEIKREWYEKRILDANLLNPEAQ